ncbi:MAG: tyrosine-type recombinase/integrase [Candidatus Binataceae bacterium]
MANSTEGKLPEGIYWRGATLWIRYSVRGKQQRESTGSNSLHRAKQLLKKRTGQVEAGTFVGPASEKVTFDDLAQGITSDYRANNYASIDRLQCSLRHLREHFGAYRAVDIKPAAVTAYKDNRRAQGASNASINRETAALRRALTLAVEDEKLAMAPKFKKLKLKEAPARQGFLERSELDALLAELPAHMRSVMVVAYVTGWRIKSELLTRQHRHFDLDSGWLRLDPGETKNGEGREFPITSEMRRVLSEQLVQTKALEHASGRVVPWLFHHDDGRPIRSYKRAWLSACKRAGLAGKIPHDFRRTAIRNLERAGVPRSASMKMVGHSTEEIYKRYAICDALVLQEAAAKLSSFHESEDRTSKVESLDGLRRASTKLAQ